MRISCTIPFCGDKPVEEIVARPSRFGCDVEELVGELVRVAGTL